MNPQPEQDLRKKVRRLFASRTTNQKEFKVTVEKNAQQYKTIIAPYEPTVDKILALFQAEQAKAKSAHFHFDLDKENRVTLHYPSDLPLKAAIDRTVKCFRKQMDAEQKRLLERAEDKILKDIGGKAPKYVAMNSDCMEGWDICKTDVLNALDELKLEQPE